MPERCPIEHRGGTGLDKVRVGALAGRQNGIVSRRQLMLLGLSERQVQSLVSSAYLHPRGLPGVYAVGHTAPSPVADLTAALLYAGPGAMLDGMTAAWWLQLVDRQPKTINVRTPRHCRSRPGLGIRARSTTDRTWHRGLPVAPIAQILLDVACELTENRLRRVLAEAEYHGWLDLATLRPALGRGHEGSTALRRALKRHEPRLAHTRSAFERRLLGLCERHELPLPEFNSPLEGYIVDALWREERVIVELDGRDGHHTWAQIQRDRERDLRLRALGFLVLRYVWRQVVHDAASVVADLTRALSLEPPLRASGLSSAAPSAGRVSR